MLQNTLLITFLILIFSTAIGGWATTYEDYYYPYDTFEHEEGAPLLNLNQGRGHLETITIVITIPDTAGSAGDSTWPTIRNNYSSPDPNGNGVYPNEHYPKLGAFLDGVTLREYINDNGPIPIDDWYEDAFSYFFRTTSGGKLTANTSFPRKPNGETYTTDKNFDQWIERNIELKPVLGDSNVCWELYDEMANEVARKMIADDADIFDNIDLVNITFTKLRNKWAYHRSSNGHSGFVGQLHNPDDTLDVYWPDPTNPDARGPMTHQRTPGPIIHEVLHQLGLYDRSELYSYGHRNITKCYDAMFHNENLPAERSLFGQAPLMGLDMLYLGWIERDELDSIYFENRSEIKLADINYPLTDQQKADGFMRMVKIIADPENLDEYFLVEFHNASEFDKNFHNHYEDGFNTGVLIWHIKGDDANPWVDLEVAVPYNGPYEDQPDRIPVPIDDFIRDNFERPDDWNGNKVDDYDWLDDFDGGPDSNGDYTYNPDGGVHIWEEHLPSTNDWRHRLSSLSSDFFSDDINRGRIADHITNFTRPSSKKWQFVHNRFDNGIAIYDMKGAVDDSGRAYMSLKVNSDCHKRINFYGTEVITDTLVIAGDVELGFTKTLTIAPGGVLAFAGSHTLTVLGKLIIQDGGELRISGRSAVVVDGDKYQESHPEAGQLILEFGAKINGSEPDRYCAQSNTHIPGDRIIVKNGGIIRTPKEEDYHTAGNPNPIQIYSRSDDLWRGITIEADSVMATRPEEFWLTHCDISGIEEIKMVGAQGNNSHENQLNFYKTNFHHAGHVYVDDGTVLSIEGSQFHNCPETPIQVYNSQLLMDVDRDGKSNIIRDNLGYGIWVKYPSSSGISRVCHTEIWSNDGGCQIDGSGIKFDRCRIFDNNFHGLINGQNPGILELSNTQIYDNGGIEFIANQDIYKMMRGRSNYFADEDYNRQTPDQHILMVTGWETSDMPLCISGNAFGTSEMSRYYPNNAFVFDGAYTNRKIDLLKKGIDAILSDDPPKGKAFFRQLVDECPESQEALTALVYLYFIESFEDRDFYGFRSYLASIETEGIPLMNYLKRVLEAKSYIIEGRYEEAIFKLELLIANSFSEDARTYAQIDEAYCFMRLSSKNNRNQEIFAFKEFLDLKNELQGQLSFNAGFMESPGNGHSENPQIFQLYQNYPNPFNIATAISYSLPEEGYVSLKIFDITGRLIKVLVDKKQSVGEHGTIWGGVDEDGNKAPSGVYFYRLEIPDQKKTRKMLLLR